MPKFKVTVRSYGCQETEQLVEAANENEACEMAIVKAEDSLPDLCWNSEVEHCQEFPLCDRCGKESEELEEVTQTIPPLPECPYGETKTLALCPTCYAIVCDGADQNP